MRFTICWRPISAPGRLQDRLHQRGDAAISRIFPHPCGGGVFAKGVHQSGVSLRANDFVRVGVECEIAVRLARDLAAFGGAVQRRHRSRTPSRPICRRSKSSMTAMPTGRPSARRLWWRTISSPPAACSANRWRDPRRPICSMWSAARVDQRRRSQPRHRRRRARPSPLRAGVARQSSRRPRQGAARGRDRADRQSGQDLVARMPGDSVMMDLSGLGSVAVSFA